MFDFIKSIGQPITPQILFGFLGFFAAVFCGGLAGAVYSSRFFVKRYKTELSLDFISEKFIRGEDIDEVIEILHQKTYRIERQNEKGDIQISSNPDHFRKVIRIGDKLDLVMFFYIRDELNKDLIDASIKPAIQNFLFLLSRNDDSERDKFLASSFDQIKGEFVALEWRKAWPSLSHFALNS